MQNKTFWIATGIALALWIGWLLATPPGLLGKADAIAYAVCARDPAHSPFLGSRQMPLCFRCTGMHLGALLTLAWLAWRAPRRGGWPTKPVLAVLTLFTGAFVVDGGNAALHDLWHLPALYPPANPLRLVTGLGMGVVIGVVVYTAGQQMLWQRWEETPALTGRGLAALLAAAGIAAALVLSGQPLVLFPIALLTTADVVFLLTLVYTLLIINVRQRINFATTWRDLLPHLAVGHVFALLQIITLDALRFALTHTWGAFPPPH